MTDGAMGVVVTMVDSLLVQTDTTQVFSAVSLNMSYSTTDLELDKQLFPISINHVLHVYALGHAQN